MEKTTTSYYFLYLTIAALLLITQSAHAAYTNHTVGNSAGWFFDPSTNTSSTNFTKWAADQTFNLGDYLIFNTNGNQALIQTYNETAYQSCNADDTSDTDTFVYWGGNEIGEAFTLSVPLTSEIPNYFFSDTYDGLQCTHGMAFMIVVKHGQGLPPNLNQPPPPPYVDPPSSDSNPSPPPTDASNQQEQFYSSRVRKGANMGMPHADRVFGFVGWFFGFGMRENSDWF